MLQEVFPGRYYLNSGDWLVNRSYGVVEAERPPKLLTWEGVS